MRVTSWVEVGLAGPCAVAMAAMIGCSTTGDYSTSSASMRALPSFNPEFIETRDEDLSILTFNVNFGLAADPQNVAAIREADADIVLLQETTEPSAEVFVAELGDVYPYLSFQDCCGAGGLGYLSKFPIADDDYREPPDVEGSWFPAWRLVIDAPLGQVQTLSVHLRPPVSDSGSWLSGQLTTPKIRAKEIEAYWELLDHDIPTIIAGDFNEGKGGGAVEFLEAKGLRSALVQAQPSANTWRWGTKLGELTAMLDHIVYDPQFALVHVEVLEEGVSDHYPVRAIFRRAASESPAGEP